MRKILLLFVLCTFAISTSLHSQCNDPAPPGLDCASAPILCAADLEGYCTTNPSVANSIAPPGFCATSNDNVQWIGFVAGSSTLQLAVTYNNCQGSNAPPGGGLQAQIFETTTFCDGYTPVSNCYTAGIADSNTFILTATGMECGSVYYLIVDGWSFDICDWTTSVVSGSTTPPPIGAIGPVSGPTDLCPNTCNVYTYSIPTPTNPGGCNNSGVFEYEWTVTGGTIIGPSLGGDLLSIQVQWSSAAMPGQVCVEGRTPCSDTVSACLDVNVTPLPDVTIDTSICQGEVIFWCGNPIFTDGTYSCNIPNADCCDQTFHLNVTTNAQTFGVIDTFLCEGETLDVNGPNGSVFTFTWENPPIGPIDILYPGGNQAGCDSTLVVVITVDTTTVEATPTDVSCSGSADGSISLNITGGIFPYDIAWNDPSLNGDDNPTNLNPGTYTVTVTSSAGCTDIDTAVINVATAVSFSVDSISDVSCNGGTNGSISLTVNGGQGPYSFNWNPAIPGNPEDPANIAAGTYQVTITDQNMCMVIDSIIVTEPDTLQISNSILTHVDCNSAANGAIDITVTGGTSGYTYTWNPVIAGNPQDPSSLGGGVYSVTVTDQNNCTYTESFTILEPGLLTVTYDSSNVSCNNGADGNISITTTNGTPPYSYAWSAAGIGDTSMADNLTAGVYTVTVSDSNNCMEIISVNLEQPTALQLSGVTTPVSCNGGMDGSIDLSVSGGVPAYSFTWSNSFMGEDPSGLVMGVYSVVVEDDNGCMDSLDFQIMEPSQLTIASIDTQISCFGLCDGIIDLQPGGGTPPYSYVWNDVNIGDVEDPNSLCIGTYDVTVTDANSCTITYSTTLTQPDSITVTGTSLPSSCGTSDGSIDLTVSGGTPAYDFDWNPPSTPDVEDPTGLSPGNYTVTVTDLNSCTQTFTIAVANPSGLSATASATPASCFGGSDGSVSVNIVGGTLPYNIVWSSPLIPTDSIGSSGLPADNYNVTVTDGANCSVIASATVDEPDDLDISFSTTDATCGIANGSISLTVTGGTMPYQFDWEPDSLDTQEDPINLFPGTYNVTVSDLNNCLDSVSIQVTSPNALNATAAFTNILCFGDSTGGIDVTVNGGNMPYEFIWNDPSYNGMEDLANLPAGFYQLSILDADSCLFLIADSITQPPALVSPFTTSDVLCNGGNSGTFSLNPTGGVTPYNFDWNDNTWDNIEDPDSMFAGFYEVTITDANNCSITLSDSIGQPEMLSLSGLTVQAICGLPNGSIDLTIDGGVLPYTIIWSDTTLNGQEDPFGLLPNLYTVTITDANGCTISDMFDVTTPNALQAGAVVTDLLCNNDNTGSIDVMTSGGTMPYTYQWGSGQTTEDISGIAAGIYSLTITDGDSCQFVVNDTVLEPAILNFTLAPTAVLCNTGTDGAIQTTVSGGTMPYAFTWSDGSLNGIQNPQSLTAGTYVLTVTDDNNCAFTDSVEVQEPAALSVLDTVVNVLCNGDSTGSILITPTGGVGNYQFDWNDNSLDGQANPSNLPAGAYPLTLSDSNACTLPLAYTITEPPALAIVSIDSLNVACFGDATGSIVIAIDGGVAPFNVGWNNGLTGDTILNLVSGTYQPSITDDNGCTLIGVAVFIDEPPVLFASGTSTDAICGEANGTIDLTVTGGTNPYMFDWSDDTLDGIEDPQNLLPGNYLITITDALGCMFDTFVVVTTPNGLGGSATSLPASCFGANDGSIDLTVVGGIPPYTYLWTNSDVVEDPVNLPAGLYTVTITDADTCSVLVSVNVDQPDSIIIDYTAIQATCGEPNGSIDLTITGGTMPYTFDWDLAPDVEDPQGLLTGNYEVTLTDANNCQATSTAFVPTPNALVSGISGVDVLCNAGSTGSIDLTVNGGTMPYDYLWSDSSLDGQEDPQNLPAGTYTVTVVDADSCIVIETQVIQEPTAFQVDVMGSDVLCNGGNSGSIDLSVMGATAPYTFDWDLAPDIEDPSGLTANTYTVTITDNNLCTATTFITINEPTALQAAATPSAASCFGYSDGSIDLTVSGGTSPYSYIWSNSNMDQDPQDLPAGPYTVTVTDDNNCQITLSETIGQPAPVSIDLDPSIIGSFNLSCFNSGDGEILAMANGGTTPYSYSWSNGASGPQIANLEAGNYTVTLTDGKGCTMEESISLTAPSPIEFDLSALPVLCFGDQNGIVLVDTAYGGIGPYLYSINGGAFSNLPSFSFLSTGIYDITVQDVAGCEESASIEVNGPNELQVDLGKDQTIILGEGITLIGDVSPPTQLNDVRWTGLTNGNDSCITAPDCLAQLEQPLETSTYSLQVTDLSGCVAFDEITIFVDKRRPVFFPNVFSPNGDGANDVFFPAANDNSVVIIRSFKVFNRWGSLVFSNYNFAPNDPANGWAGDYRQQRLDPAVFVYFAEVEFIDGEVILYKGDVTLQR